MKKNIFIVLAIVLSFSALLLSVATLTGWVTANPNQSQNRATSDAIISYQGNIYDGDTPFNGTGYFKFVFVDGSGSTSYWSNDGTSSAGSEPTTAVPLLVESGLFSVNLGDRSGTYSGMTQPLSYTTFVDYPTMLRVWFSPDNVSFTQMPDQQIATVPYALQAVESVFAWNADNAYKLNGLESNAFQLQANSKPVFSITTIEGTSASKGFHNSIIIGTDGLGLISYNDLSNDSLMVAHCENIACTSFTTSTIDDPVNSIVGFSLSITIGSDGLGVISYVDDTNQVIKVAHCDNVACTSAENHVLAPFGSYTSYQRTTIGIDYDGYPLVSYYYQPTGDLRITRCSDVACAGVKTTYTIDSVNDVGKYASMVISNDIAIIAHYDDTNDDLRVSYFSLTDSSTYSKTLNSDGTVGLYPAITLGADGMPIIAYFSLTDNGLYIDHCENLICDTVTPWEYLDVHGFGTSITIGADGFPVVSFIYPTNDSLTVVKCTSMDCASYPNYAFVDFGLGESYAYTSITIGMDGNPLISYFRLSNQDLLVAHCSSPTCQPYDWRR